MNIAVNTRLLIKNKLEGIGWFSFEVLKRITISHPEHQFFFLFDRPFEQDFVFSENVTPVIIKPGARHPVLFYYWFEYKIPVVLSKYNIDLFFSPDGYLSLKTSVKSVAVIHDINFVHRPNDLPYLVRKYYNHFFPRFAQKANSVITVSEFSKKDICETLNIESKKVNVIYNGVSEQFKPLTDKEIKSVKEEFTKGKEYFIYVGSLHKRKNIKNLLISFDIFKQKENTEHKLLIVGEKLFSDNSVEQTLRSMTFKNDIIFTGRVNSDDLVRLLGSAFAMVFIPYFEGFGLPLAEAMASGIPVVTSDRTALPEIGGDSVLYTNPDSIDDIVKNITLLVHDNELYQNLRSRGLKRAVIFDWDKTARQVWSVLEQTLKT